MSLYSIEIKGDHFYWSRIVDISDDIANEMHADGIRISKLSNTIPKWVPWNLLNIYCSIQNLINLKCKDTW